MELSLTPSETFCNGLDFGTFCVGLRERILKILDFLDLKSARFIKLQRVRRNSLMKIKIKWYTIGIYKKSTKFVRFKEVSMNVWPISISILKIQSFYRKMFQGSNFFNQYAPDTFSNCFIHQNFKYFQQN